MVWVVLLGVSTGMRCMTPMAVLCWCVWLGWVPDNGWAGWTGSLVSAVVFTVAALGEYVGDTLPRTPSRTSLFPLASRIVFGALVGVLVFKAFNEPAVGGVVFGLIGVMIGAFGGVRVRLWLAGLVGRDLPVAIAESVVALGMSVGALMVIHHDLVLEAAKARTFF